MAATAPHQLALSTRAGCECVAHMLQGVTDVNPGVTVTSIDGVSAFDVISRRAMMDGLRRVDGGLATLPFVRIFAHTVRISVGGLRRHGAFHSPRREENRVTP